MATTHSVEVSIQMNACAGSGTPPRSHWGGNTDLVNIEAVVLLVPKLKEPDLHTGTPA